MSLLRNKAGTGKDWREERHGLGPGDQATHLRYFVYQLCEYVLGVKYGSPGAKTFEYSQNYTYLTIKDDTEEVVLQGNVNYLQQQLKQAKWPNLSRR